MGHIEYTVFYFSIVNVNFLFTILSIHTNIRLYHLVNRPGNRTRWWKLDDIKRKDSLMFELTFGSKLLFQKLSPHDVIMYITTIRGDLLDICGKGWRIGAGDFFMENVKKKSPPGRLIFFSLWKSLYVYIDTLLLGVWLKPICPNTLKTVITV